MSQIQLKSFFDFCRVKVMKQSYDQEKKAGDYNHPP